MGEYYQSCPCSITNIDTSSTMQYILLLKISSIFALNFKEAPVNRDLIDMTEEEFLDFSGLPDIDDQEEKERRRKALKQHQDEVKEIHEKFANGEIDWDASIYEYSDLPDEDFVTTHTGLLGNYRTAKRGVCRDQYPSGRCKKVKKWNWCNISHSNMGGKKWSYYCQKTCKKC